MEKPSAQIPGKPSAAPAAKGKFGLPGQSQPPVPSKQSAFQPTPIGIIYEEISLIDSMDDERYRYRGINAVVATRCPHCSRPLCPLSFPPTQSPPQR